MGDGGGGTSNAGVTGRPGRTRVNQEAGGGGREPQLNLGDRAAFENYTGGAYVKINAGLGGWDESIRFNDFESETIDNLKDALNKLPDSQGEVYRSINFVNSDDAQAYVDQFTAGSDYSTDAFISTTRDRIPSFDFDQGPNRVKFTIQSRSGKDIAQHSVFPGESETLFNSGTKFKVTDVRRSTSGEYHIFMRG